jgi:hypothetical protein
MSISTEARLTAKAVAAATALSLFDIGVVLTGAVVAAVEAGAPFGTAPASGGVPPVAGVPPVGGVPPTGETQVAVLSGNSTSFVVSQFDDSYQAGDRLMLAVYDGTVMEIPDFAISLHEFPQ